MVKPKPHLILVAYYFPPAQAIGGIRLYRFYKYLKRLGYECDVITASEPTAEQPSDVHFVADNLRARWEGVAQERFSFKSAVELLMRKFMFPGEMGMMWSLEAAACCRQLMRHNPQQEFVIVCSYPALGVLLTGLLVCVQDRVRWIADFRDPIAAFLRPQTPWYARAWNELLERAVFRTASGVVANAEGAAALWRQRYPRARGKIRVIPNGFDPEDAPAARALPNRQEKVLVHAGTLYEGRNPNAVIQALARLRSARMPEAASTCILLLGEIAENAGIDRALYDQAQREGWLELRRTVPKAEALCILAEADGLLLLQPQSDVQVPGKLFEYICIGRPILALLQRSSAAEQILTNAGVRHTILQIDDEASALDRKLMEFLTLPTAPESYSEWFRSNFNVEEQTKQLARILEEIEQFS